MHFAVKKIFHYKSFKGRIQPESLRGWLIVFKPVKLFAKKIITFQPLGAQPLIWYQTVGLVLLHTYVLETCFGDIGFKSYRRNTQVSAVPFAGHVNVTNFDCKVV